MISLILRRQGGKTSKRTYLAKWMKLQCQTNEFLTFNILFHQIFLSHPPLFHTLFSPTHFHSVSWLFFLSVSLYTFYYFSISTSFYLSISFFPFLYTYIYIFIFFVSFYLYHFFPHFPLFYFFQYLSSFPLYLYLSPFVSLFSSFFLSVSLSHVSFLRLSF